MKTVINSLASVHLRAEGFKSAERQGAAAAGRRRRFGVNSAWFSSPFRLWNSNNFDAFFSTAGTLSHRESCTNLTSPPGLFCSPVIMMLLGLKIVTRIDIFDLDDRQVRNQPSSLVLPIFAKVERSFLILVPFSPQHRTWFISAILWFWILNVNRVWYLSVDPRLGYSCLREKEIKRKNNWPISTRNQMPSLVLLCRAEQAAPTYCVWSGNKYSDLQFHVLLPGKVHHCRTQQYCSL